MPLDPLLRTKHPYKLYLKDGDGEFHLIDTILLVQDDWVALLRKTAQQVKIFEKPDPEGE